MAERLATAASESLTSEVTSDRYATVIDAVAFPPSDPGQGPGSAPNPSDELTKAVTKLAGRIPQIAALFGIEAPAQKPRRPSAQRRRLRRSRLHLPPRARPASRRGRCSGCRARRSDRPPIPVIGVVNPLPGLLGGSRAGRRPTGVEISSRWTQRASAASSPGVGVWRRAPSLRSRR